MKSDNQPDSPSTPLYIMSELTEAVRHGSMHTLDRNQTHINIILLFTLHNIWRRLWHTADILLTISLLCILVFSMGFTQTTITRFKCQSCHLNFEKVNFLFLSVKLSPKNNKKRVNHQRPPIFPLMAHIQTQKFIKFTFRYHYDCIIKYTPGLIHF